MAKTIYNCDALTGGAARALDSHSVGDLSDGDRAVVLDASNDLMVFEFQSAATDAENTATHPYRVRPDDYATAGVWYEQEPVYIRKDGTLALTGDWDIGDGRKIQADKIAARDGDGLHLVDDGDNGIFVEDGGQVGFGTTTPIATIHAEKDAGSYGSGDIAALFGDDTAGEYDSLYIIGNTINGNYNYDDNDKGIVINWRGYQAGITKYRDLTICDGKAAIFAHFDGSAGSLGLKNSSPTAVLDINSDILRLRTSKTPASAGAAGNAGDICWDADYIYICTATNTWKRVAIATW